MQQQGFQPGGGRIHQASIFGNVLLLHHAYFRVQLSARVVFVKRAQIHIIVHGLLFRSRDDVRVKGGHEVDFFAVGRALYRVVGMSVMRYRRSARHNFGVISDQRLCAHSHIVFQQIGVPIEVVEVFEQRKIQSCLKALVRCALREKSGQVYGKLLVAYCRFQLRLVQRFERREAFLLLLFDAAGNSQRAPYIVVVAFAAEIVTEPHGFVFGSVHKYNSCFGVRVNRVLFVGTGRKLVPAHKSILGLFGFEFKGIDAHEYPPKNLCFYY